MYANAHRAEGAGEYEPAEFLQQLPWHRPVEVAPDEIDTEGLRRKLEELRAAFAPKMG